MLHELYFKLIVFLLMASHDRFNVETLYGIDSESLQIFNFERVKLLAPIVRISNISVILPSICDICYSILQNVERLRPFICEAPIIKSCRTDSDY
jgi:hypothetical protein